MRFPSRWFYHDELEAAPEVKYRGILDFDTPVSWIDTSELDLQEKAVAEGTGRLNTGEAELLVRELKIIWNGSESGVFWRSISISG